MISAHAAGYWAWLNSRGVSSHNSRSFSQLCGFPDIPQTALSKTARDRDTLFASEARTVRQKGDRQHILFAAGGPYFRARTTSSSPFASQTPLSRLCQRQSGLIPQSIRLSLGVYQGQSGFSKTLWPSFIRSAGKSYAPSICTKSQTRQGVDRFQL